MRLLLLILILLTKKLLILVLLIIKKIHLLVIKKKMSFTEKDTQNASIYATERVKLELLNLLYKKAPHLTSHLQYTIQQADPINDYFYESKFKPKAIKVNIDITETLCDKLSCKSVTETNTCNPNEVASIYRIGDNQFGVQCQPACFNLHERKTLDDGKTEPQMVHTVWNKNKCAILPVSTIWLEHPFYRSDTKYEERVNNLVLGFNKTYDPNTVSGLNYEFNEYYCKAFYEEFDPIKKTCDVSIWEKIAGDLIGATIIKYTKAAINAIQHTGSTIPPPDNLPPIPKLSEKYLLPNWLNDINPKFKVPDPNIQLPVSSSSSDNHTRKPRAIFPKTINDGFKAINDGDANNSKQYLLELYDDTSNLKKILHPDHEKKSKTVLETIKHYSTKLGEIFLSILEYLCSVDGLRMIGVNLAFHGIANLVKKVFKSIVENLLPKILKSLAKTSLVLLKNVFQKSILLTVSRVTTMALFKSVSTVIVGLTKLAAQLSSIIGIILAIITVFDIILTFWDPLSLNAKFSPEILSAILQNSELALRTQYQTNEPVLTFDIFAMLLLNKEELMLVHINTFQYVNEYLNHLTVNSDGSLIDKGPPINNDDLQHDELHTMTNAQLKLPTIQDFYDYEKDHKIRLERINFIRKLIIQSTIVSMTFSLLKANIVAMFCFVFTIILIIVYYLLPIYSLHTLFQWF